jgi:CRP-like cAMP-binding protein
VLNENGQRFARELFVAAFGLGQVRPPPWAIQRLTQIMTEERVPAGSVLFKAGDSPDYLYLMGQGRVLLTGEGLPSWTYVGRWVIGMFDVILERPRRHTAIVEADAHIAQVRAEEWLDLVEDNFQIVRGAVRGLSSQVSRQYFDLGADVPRQGGEPLPAPPGPMSLMERVIAMRLTPILRRATAQTLMDLAAVAEEARLPAGAIVRPRGAPVEFVSIIVEGEVTSSRPDVAGEIVFGPGAVAGGLGSFGIDASAWEVRARTNVRLLTFRAEDLFDEMEEHFDLTRAALAALHEECEMLRDHQASKTGGVVLR